MRFEIKPDGLGKYRWRLVGANDEVLAISPQSYTRQQILNRVIEIVTNALDAEIHWRAETPQPVQQPVADQVA